MSIPVCLPMIRPGVRCARVGDRYRLGDPPVVLCIHAWHMGMSAAYGQVESVQLQIHDDWLKSTEVVPLSREGVEVEKSPSGPT